MCIGRAISALMDGRSLCEGMYMACYWSGKASSLSILSTTDMYELEAYVEIVSDWSSNVGYGS